MIKKLLVITFCFIGFTLSAAPFAAPNSNAYKNANKNASFKNGKNSDGLLGDLIDGYDDRDRDKRYKDDRDKHYSDGKGKGKKGKTSH